MRKIWIIVVALALATVGCKGGESEMSKQELDALKNPSKTISPEAAAGMAKMGEMMEKQKQANQAAGVDSRGIPIDKSSEQAPPPPGG